MRQGNRQALHYLGYESLTHDEDELGTQFTLLDGWFTRWRAFFEVITELDNTPALIGVNVTTKDVFDKIGSTATEKNPFDTPIWGNESAVVVHAPHDTLPYYVFWADNLGAGGYIDLEIVQQQIVRAGQTVSFRTTSFPLGNANTAGEMNLLQELKQVIHKEKFRK